MDGPVRSSRLTPHRRAATPSSINTIGTTSIVTPSSVSSALFNTPTNANGSRGFEPRSEYLRDVLKDRYASGSGTPLPVSNHVPANSKTTSRRSSSVVDSGVSVHQFSSAQGIVDTWMLASTEAESSDLKVSGQYHNSVNSDGQQQHASRPQAGSSMGQHSTPANRRARRAHSVTTAGTPTTSLRPLGTRETEALIDRQSKENFDLKLRLCLQEERITKLSIELEQSRMRAVEYDQLQASLDENEDARSDLTERIRVLETELDAYKLDNQKLYADKEEVQKLQEDLLAELEKRDVAVNEAVSIIMNLQSELDSLRGSRPSSGQQPESDTELSYSNGQVLYLSPPGSMNYSSPTSLNSDHVLPSAHAQYVSKQRIVRSSERLRSSRDRLSLPLQTSTGSMNPSCLLAVPQHISSRPSTGAADSEYFSAQSSFSPSSSSSYLPERAPRMKSGQVPRHPQISRLQVGAHPPLRLHTLPESRTVSTGSSKFTRQSPDSTTLTCESRDSMETVESVTTASSASMNGRAVEDVGKKGTAFANAQLQHRQARSANKFQGHSRSRSANEVPAEPVPAREKHVPAAISINAANYRRRSVVQAPMSAGTNRYFPEFQHQVDQQSRHARGLATADSTPVQAHFPNMRSAHPRRPSHLSHVSHEGATLGCHQDLNLRPADSAYESADRQSDRTQAPFASEFAGSNSMKEYASTHGVPVQIGDETMDAYEVASTIATHEDMAYDSSSSAARLDGLPFEFSSSDDEGELDQGHSDAHGGQTTHGVQLNPQAPQVVFDRHMPPQPPERRSSNRASFSAGFGFLDGRKNKDGKNSLPRSSSSQNSATNLLSKSQPVGPPKGGPASEQAGTPGKSRARRLTDGPVGFLSFGKFGRKNN